MRKLFLLNVLFLFLFISNFIKVKAQETAVRCSRVIIESFSKQENNPVLQYLDDERKTADKFVRLLAEGKFDEIHDSNKRVSVWVQGNPNVEMDLTTFVQTQGKVTKFDYRSQDIIWYLNNNLISLRGVVGTWFAIKTTKTKDEFFIMLVETQRAKDMQNSIIKSVFYKVSAPELLKRGKPQKSSGFCPNHNGVLNIEPNN